MEMTNRIRAVSHAGKLLSVFQCILLVIIMTGCDDHHCSGIDCPPTAIPTSSVTTITIAYSTEKQDWLGAVINTFNQKYKSSIYVDTISVSGSLSVIDAIVGKDTNGKPVPLLHPTIWSPASSLEVNLLEERWGKAGNSGPIVDRAGKYIPQYPVSSPLVFAVWQDGSNVLSNAPYKNLSWDDIHALVLLNNWSQIGGNSLWGRVKFAHTQPDLSNSGLMTLALIASSYFNKSSDLDSEVTTDSKTGQKSFTDAKFKKYLEDIEDNVQCFGASTKPLMDTFIRQGPPNLDIITTYENLVLMNEQAAQRSLWHQPMLLYYPPGLKLESNHPFVVLQGGWVQDKQKQAALTFLSFLEDSPQQQLALIKGLRPATLSIPSNVPGDPSVISKLGIIIKPNSEFTSPQVISADVLEALINLWVSLDGSRDRQCP